MKVKTLRKHFTVHPEKKSEWEELWNKLKLADVRKDGEQPTSDKTHKVNAFKQIMGIKPNTHFTFKNKYGQYV